VVGLANLVGRRTCFVLRLTNFIIAVLFGFDSSLTDSHVGSYCYASRGTLKRFINVHIYEVRPHKDHLGFDLISDALPTSAACGLSLVQRDSGGHAAQYLSFSRLPFLLVRLWGY
jgi:hypothetical protein